MLVGLVCVTVGRGTLSRVFSVIRRTASRMHCARPCSLIWYV